MTAPPSPSRRWRRCGYEFSPTGRGDRSGIVVSRWATLRRAILQGRPRRGPALSQTREASPKGMQIQDGSKQSAKQLMIVLFGVEARCGFGFLLPFICDGVLLNQS